MFCKQHQFSSVPWDPNIFIFSDCRCLEAFGGVCRKDPAGQKLMIVWTHKHMFTSAHNSANQLLRLSELRRKEIRWCALLCGTYVRKAADKVYDNDAVFFYAHGVIVLD